MPVNYEIYILTFLDKHDNYFTLMMPVIGVPVKLSCRRGFDIRLMAGRERIQEEKKYQNVWILFCLQEYCFNSTLLHILCLLLPEGESWYSEGL